jgi:hypothetical protein
MEHTREDVKRIQNGYVGEDVKYSKTSGEVDRRTSRRVSLKAGGGILGGNNTKHKRSAPSGRVYGNRGAVLNQTKRIGS